MLITEQIKCIRFDNVIKYLNYVGTQQTMTIVQQIIKYIAISWAFQ